MAVLKLADQVGAGGRERAPGHRGLAGVGREAPGRPRGRGRRQLGAGAQPRAGRAACSEPGLFRRNPQRGGPAGGRGPAPPAPAAPASLAACLLRKASMKPFPRRWEEAWNEKKKGSGCSFQDLPVDNPGCEREY